MREIWWSLTFYLYLLSISLKQPSLARGIGQVFRYHTVITQDGMICGLGRGERGERRAHLWDVVSRNAGTYLICTFPYTYIYSNSSICAEPLFPPCMYCMYIHITLCKITKVIILSLHIFKQTLYTPSPILKNQKLEQPGLELGSCLNLLNLLLDFFLLYHHISPVIPFLVIFFFFFFWFGTAQPSFQ